MKVDLDNKLCCKDADGVEWILVPRSMSKTSEGILRRFKSSNSISPYATYSYLVNDKPKFKNKDGIVKSPVNYFLYLVIGIILLAFLIHLGVRYFDDILLTLELKQYVITIPPPWVWVTFLSATACAVIIYKVYKRRL